MIAFIFNNLNGEFFMKKESGSKGMAKGKPAAKPASKPSAKGGKKK
jgi:hypothetical protein